MIIFIKPSIEFCAAGYWAYYENISLVIDTSTNSWRWSNQYEIIKEIKLRKLISVDEKAINKTLKLLPMAEYYLEVNTLDELNSDTLPELYL